MKDDGMECEGLTALCALALIWCLALLLPKNEAAVPADNLAAEEGEYVLVIDPGHGGLDGGASTADGTPESGYNLQIALRVRDLARLLGIQTLMTREGEELNYPPELKSIAEKKRWDTRQRLALINGTGRGFLLSIHQNYYPDVRPHGAQVLYAQSELSRRWGETAQRLLKDCLGQKNQRSAVPAGKDIYLMSHVQRPAILVECGFLSNPEEALMLLENTYQLKLAAILTESFLEITEESNI